MAFAFVEIQHGLCNSFHSFEHKPHYTYGLRDEVRLSLPHLRKSGLVRLGGEVERTYGPSPPPLFSHYPEFGLEPALFTVAVQRSFDRLQKFGYRVNLVAVPTVNFCMISVCGHEQARWNTHKLFCALTMLTTLLLPIGIPIGELGISYLDKVYVLPVFRCNLTNLRFNTQYERDAVAQRAVDAILAATFQLKTSRDLLWFKDLIVDEMFMRGPYAPKDYWPEDVDVKPYGSCRDCVACCEIFVARKEADTSKASKCYEFNVCPT